MKGAMRKIIYFSLFLSFLFSVSFLAVGFAEEKPWTEQFLSQFEDIKTRIANVEKQQQELVDKDKEILEKLDQLRIWVRRK